MYVWTWGFNASAPHCNGIYPINKDGGNATCFFHNWETSTAREKLWASCTQPGREVTRLFVSDIKSRIENNGYDASGRCDADVLALLKEAHELGIRIYALFAVSDSAFSESYMASYPGQFNANCGDDKIYFDGVAVNNEHFSSIKDCDDADSIPLQQDHLDKLQLAVNNAAEYSLPLHFSLSWNWDCCTCNSGSYTVRNLHWPAIGGITKSVMNHMIDIVDSFDVQVAYIKNSTMLSRSTPAYNYWDAKTGKSLTSKAYVLSYTNPTDLCQTSYSPHTESSTVIEDSCGITTNPRTEAGMYMGFDYVESNLPLIKGSIHFMNGVYGSNITAGWHVHTMPFPIPYCYTQMPTSNPTTKPTFPTCSMSPASIVKLEATTDGPIQVFEVRAFSSGINVAKEGIASQSSTRKNRRKFEASRAIDDKNSTFSHTNRGSAWWQVSLGREVDVNSVSILNRWCRDPSDPTNCLCRLSNATLSLLNNQGAVIVSQSLGDTCDKYTLDISFCGQHSE
eukprot:CCRYP_008380-RA/>CCRYP_008380-RA protein AED:0.37 eAED:0.15 QI:0/0/0/1/1/0.5/2/0/507